MNQNPYNTPKTKSVARHTSRNSKTAYWIASGIVLLGFAAGILVLLLNSTITVSDGNVVLYIPGESVMSTPDNRRMIAYDRMIYTSVGVAIVGMTILLAIVLALVNGLTYGCRRILGY